MLKEEWREQRTEPRWKAEARRLRAEDPKRWSYNKLGEYFGVSGCSAYYAVHPEKSPYRSIPYKVYANGKRSATR